MEKVTIVIPTRDRADVLRHSLNSALALTYPNLAILVSDNASVDETAEVVGSVRDERLTYVRTPRRVSMANNWEFALSHVHGGWVTVIGDDDAVLPGGIERMLDIARETDVSAVRSAICGYSWPSLLEQKFGRLTVPLGKGYRIHQADEMLQAVIDGRQTYNALPVLYNGGFIRMEILDAVRTATGRIFCSQVPDVYSAIAICSQIERYAYSFVPLAINGASSHSGGTATFAKHREAESATDRPDAKYMSEVDFPFHPSVPLMEDGSFPPIIQCAVYECYQQAKPLLSSRRVETSAAAQLALIATEAARRGKFAEISEWIPKFCVANGISKVDADQERSWARINSFLHRKGQFMESMDTIVLNGSSEIPLRTVFEATIATGTIRMLFKSRWWNWSQRAWQFLQRKFSFRTSL